jgi:hypothetical protein
MLGAFVDPPRSCHHHRPLVQVRQSTVEVPHHQQENPNRAFAASAVKVGLKKINGNWLISSSDPV